MSAEMSEVGRAAEIAETEEEAPVKKTGRRHVFSTGCGNFSIQYNYACASIATAIMLSQHDETGPDSVPDFPEPRWAKAYLLSVVFIGSVVGMLTMGYLGDLLGIRRALLVTNSLAVVGSLASALLSWGSPEGVWGAMLAGRFVLGAGVGGIYPLSAAKAAEAAPAADEAVRKAAMAFCWQGPGSAAPYIVALALLVLPASAGNTSLQFRLVLGLGAVPLLLVLVLTAMEDHGPAKPRKRGQVAEALRRPRYWRALGGTAGAWLLFDVAFYGTVIFAPNILAEVFGERQTLVELARRACLMASLGIFGTIVGVAIVPRVGAKALNTIGLVVGSLLYATFAAVKVLLPDRPMVLFALLCMLYVVLYAGPNVATYVLPVLTYPPHVRSTFHGISSAAAKVGAMLGSLLFPFVGSTFGVPAVMATQAAVCAAAAVLNHVCLSGAPPSDDGGSSTEGESSPEDGTCCPHASSSSSSASESSD